MSGMLEGKVVAITGAGRGVGREIALLCARHGAAVVVNDPGVGGGGDGGDAGPAQQTVDDILAAGGRAHANLASVADPVGAQSIIEDAVQRFGRIDAVVNNAGILRDTIWHKMSHEDWRAVIDHLSADARIDAQAIAWIGVSMGTAYGLPLVAADPRIRDLRVTPHSLSPYDALSRHDPEDDDGTHSR